MTILVTVLWHHLHISRGAGSRCAQAFSASVGDVVTTSRPPVIASAPALCTEVTCLVALAKAIVLGPWFLIPDGDQTSMAYNTIGSATLV